MNATAQMFHVQQYLRKAGVETILGPPLNIGITNERRRRARDGTSEYPGSLTISRSHVRRAVLDVLRSLHDNGLRRAFLWPGHLGSATRRGPGRRSSKRRTARSTACTRMSMIDSEVLRAMKLAPSAHILSVEKGRNFEMMAQLLGRGAEMPRTTHADGVETSWTLYFHPEVVRPGYQQLPHVAAHPSSTIAASKRDGRRIRVAVAGSPSTRRRRQSASRSSTTRPPASATPYCRWSPPGE